MGQVRARSRSRLNLSHSLRRRFQTQLRVEQLENRVLLSAYPLGPAQVRHAYGFDQLTADGTGQTIAIIDAYDDPNIFKDVNTFDQAYGWNATGPSLYSQFGSSSSFLTKATPQGKTRGNSGWAQEISLDVEWAHAIAPAAQILLVEAKSNSLGNLLSAVDYASSQPGVVAVSMSWGSGEFSGETSMDGHFTTSGITYVASSGDSAPSEWPAASPNVLSVGGSSLTVDSSGNYGGETAWNNVYGTSGGGVSPYESKPSYQSSLSGTNRSTPDVAYNADPATGFAVYDSYIGGGGWGQYGGTSAGAPQWAALIALANQGRSTKLSSSGTLSALYGVYGTSAYSTNFNDVVGNGATGGYDLLTGLGSPKAKAVVSLLQSAPASAVVTTAAQAASTIDIKKAPPLPPPTVNPAAIELLLLPPVQITNQPAVITTTPLPRVPDFATAAPASVPASAPVQLFLQRQESGGGDNAFVTVSDSDSDTNGDATDVSDVTARVENSTSVGDAVARATASYLPSMENASATSVSWKEACTAYFATDPSAASSFKLTQDNEQSSAPAAAMEADQVIEPGAALAAIAFVLGGYWGRQTEAPESEKRRRIAGL
jgi:hypothetical protein